VNGTRWPSARFGIRLLGARLLAVGTSAVLLAACGSGRAGEPAATAAPAGASSTPATASASSSPTTASSPAITPSMSAMPEPTESTGPTSTGPTGLPTLPASVPVSLSVPAIGVDSALVELGRNPDGTVQVPSLDDPDAKPGWYRDSPAPGAPGPAIILGHVDSRRYGPGVFYHLKDLQAGDRIDVTRADATVARFAVDSVREVAKSDFPTLEVYGNLDHAGLRLITCGGEFDPDAASYESNIIVFASLVISG
jgi:hypothetical protein